MKKQVLTIGGERLGSGKKMKTAISNYNRSTHNLSGKRATSMAPGVLYPIRTIQAMRGDSFDINLEADIRTLPTKGALFGSYKLQIDVFQCPIRLYQGILHNNPLAIGLKMNEVKFPIYTLGDIYSRTYTKGEGQCNNTCLLKYLGLSGIGVRRLAPSSPGGLGKRKVNAVPVLAYYDIYKNYYANKQEENGYFIDGETVVDQMSNVTRAELDIWKYGKQSSHDIISFTNIAEITLPKNVDKAFLKLIGDDINKSITINIGPDEVGTLDELKNNSFINSYYINNDSTECTIDLNMTAIVLANADSEGYINIQVNNQEGNATKGVILKAFPLTNIDKMRYALLSNNELGTTFDVSQTNIKLPYKRIAETDDVANFHYPMHGLAIKTYQNDMFNNWLNIDWLEGANSISEMTNVAVTNGKFSMDALNFAQKLYNMLNRVVLAGNTYEDWQDVVYEEVKRRQIESPIFCGGMSKEIIFDEILQTSPTEDQPLGTIGGRGRFAENSKKGGKLHIKCDEACYIMVIASLTPRVYYTQGNEFYMTDIFTIDDLHKPALDGIGFQDLVGERMLWSDTTLMTDGTTWSVMRSKVGKLPAWIEYMTEVDKAFGDFAEDEGRGYMILNRNYEGYESLEDATTYVDPSKYNYAFADASLTAQNFWLEVGINCIARRLMSARIIPNV